MTITQEITLDISAVESFKFVGAKQADDDSRFLKVRLMDGGTELTVASGSTVTIRALKPDGTSCYNNGTVNSDGTVTVELTSQILAVAGNVLADISITSSTQVLSSASFIIRVEKVPLGTAVTSSNEFLQLTALIQTVNTKIEACEEAVEDCEEAIENIDQAAVRTTAQTLTDAQKLQARKNITDTGISYTLCVDTDGYICIE